MKLKRIFVITGLAAASIGLSGCNWTDEDWMRFWKTGAVPATETEKVAPKKAAKQPNILTKAGDVAKACVVGVVDAACDAVKATDKKLKELRLALKEQNVDFIERSSRLEAAKKDAEAARMAMVTVKSDQQEQLLYNLRRARDNESAARAAANASEARRLTLLREASKLEGELAALSRTAATASTVAKADVVANTSRTAGVTTSADDVAAAANASRVAAEVKTASPILKNLANAGRAVGKFAGPPAAILTGAEALKYGDDTLNRMMSDTNRTSYYRAFIQQASTFKRIELGSDSCDYTHRNLDALIDFDAKDYTVKEIEDTIIRTGRFCRDTEEKYREAWHREEREKGYVDSSVVITTRPQPIAPATNNQQMRDLLPTATVTPSSGQNIPLVRRQDGR